jgi:hypothetical protein
VPAPGLRETAEIWWDAEIDPYVTWDPAGARFTLVDGADDANTLQLWAAPDGRLPPQVVAEALAEGLAACDFPPTGDGVSEHRAEATLRAAGLL